MQKISRLLAIEKIIGSEEISSQEELMQRLKAEGIECTQATLSRNLRQLGVMKIPGSRGGYRYSLTAEQNIRPDYGFNIISVIRTMIDANSMVVLKTDPGHANSVAVIIDKAGRYEIAGTIAGDDTLLIIQRDTVTNPQVHSCLEIIFPGLHEQSRRE